MILDIEYDEKDPKFRVCDHIRISTYVFAKGYISNWSEKVFVIKKVKNTVPWTYVMSCFIGGEIAGAFYEKKLQKINQKEFRIEKGEKGINYVTWKGYSN